MVIDAHERRLPFADHCREVAEPAQITDVERCNDVGAFDFTHCPIARVGAGRNQEVEAFGNGGRVGDADIDAAGAQQVPQTDFTPHAVAVGIDVRRQNDVTRTGQCCRHVASRRSASRRDREAVRVHLGKIIGSSLAPTTIRPSI